MKYTLLILLSCMASHSFAQSGSLIHVGSAEKLTVTAGGLLHADGISLSPTENFSLSNNTLKRVSASNAKLANQVSRVFQFTNPTALFTGKVTKGYLDSELNGLPEQSLQLFVFNADKWYRQSTVNNVANNSLSSNVDKLSLGEISSAVFMPDLILTASSIAENSPFGTKVIDLLGTSQNIVGNDFIYTLVSGTGSADNASFTIKGAQLQTNSVLDFETKKSYSVRLRVTDGYGRLDEKVLVITITDVNEAPTALALSKANLYELNSINDVVGLLSTSDQDVGDAHTYSLVSGTGSTDNGAFNVNGNQIRALEVYTYSRKSSYSIRLRTTDKGGLSFENIYTISISEKPVITGTGNERGTKLLTAASASPKISKGFTSNLNVSGSDMVSFSWSPSATLNSATTPNPVATPPQTQTYSVIVTNRFGSSTTVAITVEVMEDFNIVANNILTPDGDGQNDLWFIENLSSYPVNKLIIFDRIGQVIYSKNNYANEWNGLYNGISLPEGTYFYVLSIKNGSSQKSGFITLVK